MLLLTTYDVSCMMMMIMMMMMMMMMMMIRKKLRDNMRGKKRRTCRCEA